MFINYLNIIVLGTQMFTLRLTKHSLGCNSRFRVRLIYSQ